MNEYQLCIFCAGTGIDEEGSSGGTWDSGGSWIDPPYIEPCICTYTHAWGCTKDPEHEDACNGGWDGVNY